MKHLGVTQDGVADVLHKDRTVISKIFAGKQPLQIDQLEPVAKILEVSPLEILYRAGTWTHPMRIVAAPVLTGIQAGKFTEILGVERGASRSSVLVQYERETIFALRVEGDSMDRIAPEGSLVIVDYKTKDLRDRDLGVFLRNSEATFKRYRRDDDEVWIEPDSDNPRHGPIMVGQDETIEIIGRVIEVRPDYHVTSPRRHSKSSARTMRR